MTEQTAPTRLVTVGSSAGGIEALVTLVSSLPAEFPAPIVIAQHLDPARPSRLEEILQRRSALPVRTVQDQTRLQAGTIYIVPANQHVEVTDHALQLRAASDSGAKPSVDRLFSSAAPVFGERLVVVVLTGTGSDGALGARLAHEAGGTVIIQNPATAAFPGMPRALLPTTVDIVAELDELGAILQRVVASAGLPALPAEERQLRTLLAQLRERRAVDFSSYKRPTILRRLQRRLVATRCDTLAAYLQYLEAQPEEEECLVRSLLIKVTDFFRDADTFRYLQERVLPSLLATAHEQAAELRLWSAGCATGEEAYSLAILVADLLGPRLAEQPVRIFATDLDAEALAFARRGVYPAKVLEHMPTALRDRYLTLKDDAYTVNKVVRDLIVFGPHDLGQRSPFPAMDLVLCRNVLMYFTPPLQERTLQLFAFSLRQDGYLVLGSAESIRSATPEYFTPENMHLKVFRRTGARAVFPFAHEGTALEQVRPAREGTARTPAAPRAVPPPGELQQGLLLRLPVGLVTVNRRYDVQLINAMARRLLGIHGRAVGEDFIHLLDSIPSRALRAGIDRAFRQNESTTLEELAVAEMGMGEERVLQIHCSPIASDGSAPEQVMILINDVTALVRKRQAVEDEAATQQAELARLTGLMEKLGETNRRLLEANEQLATAEETPRTTNEEYLAVSAEAQTASEELETFNEELQASNEELETLNEELKATIEELNTTNADLTARSEELAQQQAATEQSRAELAAVLASMRDAVIVVDAHGQVVRSNTAYDTLAAELGAAFVPHDAAGEVLPAAATPRERAARGETFSLEFTVPTADGGRRWFEASGQPFSTTEATPARGVLIIRDISDRSLRRLQEQFVGHAAHELRTPLTALSGRLQLLHRRLAAGAPPESLADNTRTALEQVKRLQALVDELTDVTRLQTGRLALRRSVIDLATIATRAVTVAQEVAAGQTIDWVAEAAPVWVEGDADRLEGVLLNLLVNAIKYAPDTERIRVALQRSGGMAAVTVADEGPGIAAAELPKIFAQFYQAPPRHDGVQSGLGLGLFLAQQIVTAHGGRIDVHSEEGHGTTFTVWLPLADAPPDEHAA